MATFDKELRDLKKPTPRFPQLPFEFVDRSEFDDISKELLVETEVGFNDIRLLHFFIIEGMSGVGKTRTAVELAKKIIKEKTDKDTTVIYSMHAFTSTTEKITDDQETGYYILCKILASQFEVVLPTGQINWLKLFNKMLLKWMSFYDKESRFIWILHLDEFQYQPDSTRALLRAIKVHNNRENNRINIFPILTGTSSLNIKAEDLLRVTGYSSKKYTLKLMKNQKKELFKSAVAATSIIQNEYLEILGEWLHGWPMAYLYFLNASKALKLEGELSLEDCSMLFQRIVREISSRYADQQKWCESFGTDSKGIKKVLLLAATGISVIYL